MAEMRALIFNLRPEALETEGLAAVLGKQAASLRARHHIDVHANLCDEPELPFAIKEALYRIAQEALHNTVKHARASRVDLKIECTPEEVTLGYGTMEPALTRPAHFPATSVCARCASAPAAWAADSRSRARAGRAPAFLYRRQSL